MTSDPIDDFEADLLPPGTAIGGFTVGRVIGKGGFGITYAARNRVTERDAAIKEFFPSRMARRDAQSRLIYSRDNAETVTWALRKFEETTRTLCDLVHPNIVRVFDYVPLNNTGYMVMELLDGATLKDHLFARAAPPRLDELRALLDPVMEALAYVHGRGLIHRDIAPDNILITRAGRPVLIDFGAVSRDLGDAADLSSTVGLAKRHYTAPEQMRARARPTPAGDVYSMGAVLYRALSGHDPADGQERVDTMFLGQEPDPYRPLAGALPPGCPPEAAQAIDQALALRAVDRQASIALLREQLDELNHYEDELVPDALPVGTVIGGYTIRRVLDQGGLAITYEAYNHTIDRPAAIREFFPARLARRDARSRRVQSTRDAEIFAWALDRFEAAADLMCRLRHPNLVQAIDYIPANDTGYMLMELVGGTNLEDHLRARAAPPSLDELWPLVEPVMAALSDLHMRDLVHGDVTPDNILIAKDGRPALREFGFFSRDIPADRADERLPAKRFYTAPEAMRPRAQATQAGDVYAMGAVLYVALRGQVPADADWRLHQVVLLQEPDPYEPLALALPPGCPLQAAQAIDKALAFRPEDRPASIALLREQLGASAPRRGSFVRRVPVDVLAVVAAAVSSLLCVGYSEFLWPLIKDWLPSLVGAALTGTVFGLSLATLLMLLGRRHPGRLALLVLLTTVGWSIGYIGCGRGLGFLTKLHPKDQLVWSLYYTLMSLCGSAGTLAGCAIAERAFMGWKRTSTVVAAAAALSAALGVATAWVIDVLNFGVYLLICFYTWQAVVMLGIVRGRYPSHGRHPPPR